MNAYLLLANGMVFAGQSVGAEGVTVGEVVFATGMVGFQETLTDPSYYGQIITQTYPLIGNYGMNKDDMESDHIWAKGYIVREACTTPSNWRCEETLDSFLSQKTDFPFEILVHDDCSSDGTVEILEEYARRYPDVVCPVFEKENQYSKGVPINETFNFPRARGKLKATISGATTASCRHRPIIWKVTPTAPSVLPTDISWRKASPSARTGGNTPGSSCPIMSRSGPLITGRIIATIWGKWRR